MLNSKCPPVAWAHARCLPRYWSIVSSKIDCSKCIDELPFQFIHTMDLSVIDTILHDSPDVVIHRTKICDIWRPQVGGKKVWRFLTQQFSCCTCAARCADALSCWNTKSLPDTLRIVGSSMTSWSSITRYHQNFLLCNNNEITACIGDFFNSFCEEVHVVAFFELVQQQTIGEVANSITYFWADNFCLQQWKNY